MVQGCQYITRGTFGGNTNPADFPYLWGKYPVDNGMGPGFHYACYPACDAVINGHCYNPSESGGLYAATEADVRAVIPNLPLPSFTITSVTAMDIGDGWISVNVNTSGAGTGRITINGVEKERFTQIASQTGYGTQFYVGVGTHTICAEVV